MARQDAPAPAQVRLAEVIASLSLGVDLGFGQPMEHVLRQTHIAMGLAEQLGLDDGQRADLYYTALLLNVGCHTDAHEQAVWFGDDIAMKAVKYDEGLRTVGGALAMVRLVGGGRPLTHRLRVGLELALFGRREVSHMIEGHAAMAERLAEQLSLPDSVRRAVAASYEQWDGHGWPGNLKGDAIPLASRVCLLAEFTEVADRAGGADAAVAVAERGAGKQFDPELVRAFLSSRGAIVRDLGDDRTWDLVIAEEPSLTRILTGAQVDEALLAVADFVDLKSPYFLGHSRAVAGLTDAAAGELGWDQDERAHARRAALVAGFGRLGISNAIWDKPGRLGTGERERVRLHPYLTGRMLEQSEALTPFGKTAALLRERIDGSGYPSGRSGAAIPAPARLLAAADVYQSLLEPRPHRRPFAPDAARAELDHQVRTGRLDGDAVDAVLTAAGHAVRARRDNVDGLTPREIEVLTLVARGWSSREVSRELSIAPKTVRNHVEHIYAKIGVSSRAAASLYAVQHGMVDPTAGSSEGSPPSRSTERG